MINDPLTPLLYAYLVKFGFHVIQRDIEPGHDIFQRGAAAWHIGSPGLGAVAMIVVDRPTLKDWISWDDEAILFRVDRADKTTDTINRWTEVDRLRISDMPARAASWIRAMLATDGFKVHREYYLH